MIIVGHCPEKPSFRFLILLTDFPDVLLLLLLPAFGPLLRCTELFPLRDLDVEILRQLPCCINWKESEQIFHKVDHVAVRPAAEAMISGVNLHARYVVCMERTSSHPVPTNRDSVLLCSLSGCDMCFNASEDVCFRCRPGFRYASLCHQFDPPLIADLSWFLKKEKASNELSLTTIGLPAFPVTTLDQNAPASSQALLFSAPADRIAPFHHRRGADVA